MNYIEKLTDEELIYICNQITGKNIKKYFQNHSQKYFKIRSGFPPNRLSGKEAVELVVEHRNKPFILTLINEQIDFFLKEVDTQRNNLMREGNDSESALLLTLPQTVFSERLDIYFKIAGQSYSQEYIQLAKSAIQLLPVKQGDVQPVTVQTDENPVALKEQLHEAKKEWEYIEHNYIHDIEKLKSDVEETRRELTRKEDELSQADTIIEELKTKLDVLNKLEANVVSCGDFIRDEGYQCTSLCMVFYDYNKEMLRLKRLSDIEDGVILGERIPGTPEYNKLYVKEKDLPGPEGFVGLWDWKVVPNPNNPNGSLTLSVYKDSYIPVEIFIVQDCTSMSDLLERLEYGIMDIIAARRMIFAYQNENKIYEGVFCTSKNLDITERRVRLKSNVFSLPCFLLAEEDMFFTDKRCFHRRINIGRPDKMIRVKNPLEVVKDILVERTTWTVMKQKGFIKSQHQNFNSFLKELPTDELYEKIACACECSMTEAEGLVEQFMEHADKYLNHSDLEGEVLSCCVKNHPALLEACESLIEDKWKEKNALQIAKANETLELVQREAAQQSQLLEQLTAEYTETKKKLDDALAELERQQQLAADVERQVSDRMERARSHAAEFIAEMAFRVPVNAEMNTVPQADISMAAFIVGEHLPAGELERNSDWNELKETIRLELFEAGVSEKYAEGLGTYLYAAYVNHVPLLLAGPCAHDIADAFSAALFGRLAATLRLEGNYCTSIVEQCLSSEETVIVIENPFSSAWNPYLPEIIADKNRFYIGIHPYAEDLLIEPHSFFNYMMPLLTEHFVDRLPTRKFVGGYMEEGVVPYVSAKPKAYYNKLFHDMKFGILGRNLLQQILTDMHILLQDDSADYDCLFALLPYAYVCDRADVFLTYLNERIAGESSISSELFSYINACLGETE